jgi:hypothetical protein
MDVHNRYCIDREIDRKMKETANKQTMERRNRLFEETMKRLDDRTGLASSINGPIKICHFE